MKMELLCNARCKVGESPVWTDGALYWVDIEMRQLHCFQAGQHRKMDLPCTVSAIAPAARGFVAAGGRGFGLVTPGTNAASFEPLANVLSADVPMRMNDGALDRQGRFWAGSMGMPVDPQRPAGQLFCLDGKGEEPVLGGLSVQNGLAFSLDGKAMYLSDSHPRVAMVWRFDYDTERGIPSNRSIFSSSRELGGRPDGAAMDTDGCYWVAASDGGQIVRLTPQGQVDTIVEVPTRNPTNVCFGGADRRTMFVTSLISSQPDSLSGDVFVLESPWQGIADVPWIPPT